MVPAWEVVTTSRCADALRRANARLGKLLDMASVSIPMPSSVALVPAKREWWEPASAYSEPTSYRRFESWISKVREADLITKKDADECLRLIRLWI